MLDGTHTKLNNHEQSSVAVSTYNVECPDGCEPDGGLGRSQEHLENYKNKIALKTEKKLAGTNTQLESPDFTKKATQVEEAYIKQRFHAISRTRYFSHMLEIAQYAENFIVHSECLEQEIMFYGLSKP